MKFSLRCVGVLLVVLLSGCACSQSPARSAGEAAQQPAPKRITAAVMGEPTQVLAQIVHHTTGQLNLMGLFYDTETTMIANRLLQATARDQGSTQAWNAHEWELRRDQDHRA